MRSAFSIASLVLLVLLASVSISAQQPELVMQVGHTGTAEIIAFIHGGRSVVTLGPDKTVKVWEVETGKLLKTMPGIAPVALSPDGQMLATTTLKRTVRVWNLNSGQLARALEMKRPAVDVHSLAFSSDGRTLAAMFVGSYEGMGTREMFIRTWNLSDGAGEDRLLGRASDEKEFALDFGEDGRAVAVEYDAKHRTTISPDRRIFVRAQADYDKDYTDVELRETNGGRLLSSFRSGVSLYFHVRFVPGGKTLLATDGEKTVKFWDVATGRQLNIITHGLPRVSGISLSPDDRILAVGGDKNEPPYTDNYVIKLFDAATGRLLQTLAGANIERDSEGPQFDITFSPDGKLVGSGDTLWDIETGRTIIKLTGNTSATADVQFSPDEQYLLISDNINAFTLWDMVGEREPRVFEGEVLSFLPDGRELLVRRTILGAGEKAGTLNHIELEKRMAVELLEVATGNLLRRFESSSFNVLSPDGKTLAIGPGAEAMRLNFWDVATGKLTSSISGFKEHINFVTFSPDGKRVALGVDGETSIRIFEVASGRILSSIIADKLQDSVTFSPDGKSLAGIQGGMSSPDYSGKMVVTTWDASSGRLLYTRPFDGSITTEVSFSPDGQILVGSSFNAILWNASTGKQLHTLAIGPPPAGADMGISTFFSPDGKFLVSLLGYTNGARVQVWDVATGEKVSFLNDLTEDPQSVAFSRDGRRFVTLGRDGIVKLWDWRNKELIASLVVGSEREWLAVAPDGRFDGTPAGWSKIFWRFGRDIFGVEPVEIFFQEFFYPGLLSDISAGRLPPPTQNPSQKDRRQPRVKLALAGGSNTGEAVGDAYVNVRVEVEEAAPGTGHEMGSGAQDMRLFRNGTLVKLWRGDVLKGRRSATFEERIPIVAGENRFTAYAFNRDNVKSADAALAVMGAESLKRPATAYVLAVGINRYANASFNLNFAVADAEEFAGEWQRQQARVGRFAETVVVPLLDAEATKANIMLAIKRLVEVETTPLPAGVPKQLGKLKYANPEDGVVIYFAGHGTAHGNRFYLIPHDLGYEGRVNSIAADGLATMLARSISDRELEEAFERLNAGQLLMVLDACNSGQALEAEEKRRGPMNSKGLAQLAYEKGMYILTAAQSFQAAQEASQLGHGLLTFALVEEGLKQAQADREPKDGTVFMREWLNYATERVPEMQIKEMKRALARGMNLSFREEERGLNINQRSGQRPRVFYRRELEAQPVVIARPALEPPKK